MQYKKIRLAYRAVIDQQSTWVWDRYVFEDTYKEYLMQHQLFNDKDNPKNTFRELLAENEKAEQLHYLVGIAANGYIEQLKGKLHRVPDVLGNQFLPFSSYRLDIVNTDIVDATKHKIGITFYSPPLLLVDIINNCYLVSAEPDTTTNLETMMFPMQPHLAICAVEHTI
ncbi:hypothetical protein [Flavobacterium caeni]|uniref:Uncharacterized protein n=1 Tax=Flavobacterium caeni TaxID=490189 RepID=A0A1G5G8H1_9FLAO|nr:hypothetical protein [Flavobacterium caeni]SCY47599.1 hypothetical protein SAMN02927903_01481 [Flavobacterium caeni]